jgi:hypothetical protein
MNSFTKGSGCRRIGCFGGRDRKSIIIDPHPFSALDSE